MRGMERGQERQPDVCVKEITAATGHRSEAGRSAAQPLLSPVN